MNKQEVIEKIEGKRTGCDDTIWGGAYDEAIDDASAIVRQLDEPEKPVLPQFVADWIEWCKRNKVSLLGAMSPIDELGTAICDDKKVESLEASKWATRNQETFAQAWLFGYKVDKEKLYTVELPNPNEPDSGHIVLHKDEHNKVYIDWHYEDDWKLLKSLKLTESEIKQDFDWAWPFAKEVKE